MKTKKTKDQKFDKQDFDFHQQGDVLKRNHNIDAKKTLCERCSGTGNEFYSMYKRCTECDGKGYIER